MIERQFVSRKIMEFKVQEFISSQLGKAEYNRVDIKKTPLGEKIIIYTTKPGLIVGKKGENISRMTEALKEKFGMKSPQIEVAEVQNPNLDPHSVGERMKYILETYGAKRFKFIGYNALKDVMNAGAKGAEVVLSGKIPSARAKTWRFMAGYLKKSGDIAASKVLKAYSTAKLKVGIVGIKVSILLPDVMIPDKINIHPVTEEIKIKVIEEKVEEKAEETKKSKKTAKNKEPVKNKELKNKETKKKTTKKITKKVEAIENKVEEIKEEKTEEIKEEKTE